MKAFSVLLATFAILLAGCQKADINNTTAVQAAVKSYIESRGDLSLSELEITVKETVFAGDRCDAQVQFVPKGQPEGSGMTMSYQLERAGDTWKVIPRAGGGHGMQMSAPPEGADGGGPDASGGGQGGGAPVALPPGHPTVSPEGAGKN